MSTEQGSNDKREEQEVAPVTEGAVTTTEDDRPLPASLQSMIDVAKTRYRTILKLKEFAIQHTKAYMWTIQGGNPWLNSQGTDHMERLFGISSKVVDKEKLWETDEAGERYFIWVFVVEVGLPNSPDKCDGVGSATSRDKFLGELEATERRKGRTLADVEPNVLKKAWTDAKRTAIQRLLGLRGLSWNDLAAAGIKRKDVNEVTYGGK